MLSNSYHNSLRQITAVLKQETTLDDIDVQASFSSLGITSLRAAQLIININQVLNTKLKTYDLFLYPTPHALAHYLTKVDDSIVNEKRHFQREPIAIIAMDCKYPGADDCESFWENCASNKESITFFDRNKGSDKGDHDFLNQVYARGVLNDIEYFDAQFFNYSPREAHLSDPQHRLFIEAAWKALEGAGYASEDKSHGKIGVYASMNDSTYILDQLALQGVQTNLADRSAWQRLMSSQFLATKVAYLLNCTGPSITVQTACSSSLVAVALACQQLVAFECDMAIAGGVSILTPQNRPYVYQEGNIYSPDGHCRPFSADAQGTVFSNGLGVVVLKRLSEAIRDRDPIVSVIKGYGLNNDGNNKMGYAAPSMQGQLDCIVSALSMAEVEASSIQYVETHGTGTRIGDPIEIEALKKAFQQTSSKEQFCAIGSVKANIGHTHVAAGIAGLIKASFALQHQQIPPALNFKTPNPDINFKRSPFYVNTRLLNWRKRDTPRRAAVSAFGVGGTNAHLIVEEAPKVDPQAEMRKAYSVVISAKSEDALRDYNSKLIDFLEVQCANPDSKVNLGDFAYTLHVGRNHYSYRQAFVAESLLDALAQLKVQRARLNREAVNKVSHQKKIVFLLPGQGTHYVNMSQGLYHSEPVYKEELDKCLNIASQVMSEDLHKILFPSPTKLFEAESKLLQTQYIHPILFSVEYALTKLLEYWGVVPDAMLGHSLGEYVAACISGVFELEDAIQIICARGNAIASCNGGAMLSVALSREELEPFCSGAVNIAVETAPNLQVISGPISELQSVKDSIEKVFYGKSLSMKWLKNLYPFHTDLLVAAVEPFQKTLKHIKKNRPKIPYLSNLTGDWVADSEALTEQYWIEHMLQAVKLSKCAEKLLDNFEDTVFIEVGPGNTLSSVLQMHTKRILKTATLVSAEKINKQCHDDKTLATALKKLWCYGCSVDWKKFYAHESRSRLILPTYPFQKQRFWIDAIKPSLKIPAQQEKITPDLSFYTPSWVCDARTLGSLPTISEGESGPHWIIFANQSEICRQTCELLAEQGARVVRIFQEKDKASCESRDYIINPKRQTEYDHVLRSSLSSGNKKYSILHFWGFGDLLSVDENDVLDSEILYQGLYSGIFIAQAFSQFVPKASIYWTIVTDQLHTVLGHEKVEPLKSGILSLCKVLPLENPKIHIKNIDIEQSDAEVNLGLYCRELISQTSCENKAIVALRSDRCWKLTASNISLPAQPVRQEGSFVDKGVYLITGGLGGMGLTLAQWISKVNPDATLVLLSRSFFPNQERWDEWVSGHPDNNAISKKINILKQITEKSCRVVVLKVDIGIFNQIKDAVSLVEEKYGIVQGIFHLAGVSGKGLVALKKLHDVKKVLHPKLVGTRNLIHLFCKKELDFFVSASSLTAIVGGVGQIDYCAANIFIDACLNNNMLKNCKRTLTINWNAWRSVGMAVGVKHASHCRLYAGNSVTPKQGAMILNQLFDAPYNQVIVSRYSPENEVDRINKVFQQRPEVIKQQQFEENKQANVHNVVRRVWEDILGIRKVDKTTSFHDCGGDSLTLIQLIALLEQRLGVKFTLQELAQYSTFGEMTDFIEEVAKPKVS